MRIQGIRKYHDLESYIEKNIKDNKELLEEIIGFKFSNIHMEVGLSNYRVDLVGQMEDRSMALIEVSIRHSNLKDFHIHRNQILRILDYIGKDRFVQIILISPQFLNDDIKEIENCILSYNTKVYFVQLSKETIFNLQNTFDLKSIFNDCRTQFSNYLSVTSRNINKNDMFLFTLDGEEKGNHISKEILQGLRKEISWHIPLHRYKDLSKSIIRIGSGIADIMFNIYCNKDDVVRIELNFAKRFDIFNEFKNYMIDMSDFISYPLCLSCNKTSIFSDISKDKNGNYIYTAIEVTKEYIEYVTSMYQKIELNK